MNVHEVQNVYHCSADWNIKNNIHGRMPKTKNIMQLSKDKTITNFTEVSWNII